MLTSDPITGQMTSDIPWLQNAWNSVSGFFGNIFGGNSGSSSSDGIKFRADKESEAHEIANQLGLSEMTDTAKEYILEYMLNDRASEAAWNRSVFASKNQNQWLVEDLKKAGLNPFLALSGLGSASAQSSGQSVSGGLLTSKANNQRTNEAAILKTLMTALASIIGIALFKKP